MAKTHCLNEFDRWEHHFSDRRDSNEQNGAQEP